jgi:glyoxylate reductase
MAARSIFVTWPMEAEVRAILERVGSVRTSPTEHELPIPELARHVADVEAIIPMGAHPIPEPVIAAAPRLRIVAVAAVGYNIVDVAAATRRGILVTNTPGVLTDTTADMAWALMLGVARRVPESDRFVRAGKWTGVYWSQLMGADVHGTTLGVIGLGRIGQAIARRAQGFGMRVLYHKRTPDPEAARSVNAEYRSKADLLRESDFVVLSIPLTAETRHLIGAAELALMKPTAFLVNVARGPVVDEAALVDALRARRIAGAGLDVFEDEPKVHPGLLELENLALTPHIGSASGATRRRMATRAAENCVAALEGRRPPDLVNPEAWRPA